MISSLKEALKQSQFAELKRIAHQLKGSSSNLRLSSIVEILLKLEQSALNENTDLCNNHFNHLELELNLYTNSWKSISGS
jgi:HPt (histidine-containing phosphotransfer) domain-containing protein